MHEYSPASNEREPKRQDAAQLAEMLYFALDRAEKTGNYEVGEVAETISHYFEYRAKQDPEMGHMLVYAFEAYRDPQPEMETLGALQGMQDHANRIRELIGLPGRELPDEIPPPAVEPWTPPQ